jgi:DNA-binding XRE family transcriptional regulator
MLSMLAAARVEAGYNTKKSFVEALNKAGLVISRQTYNRIESGNQPAEVEVAIFIADFLEKDLRQIFLTTSTQKMSRNKSVMKGA